MRLAAILIVRKPDNLWQSAHEEATLRHDARCAPRTKPDRDLGKPESIGRPNDDLRPRWPRLVFGSAFAALVKLAVTLLRHDYPLREFGGLRRTLYSMSVCHGVLQCPNQPLPIR